MPAPRIVFIDAAGTLIHVRESVGTTYCRAAARLGLVSEEATMARAFRTAWKQAPAPQHGGVPSPDDDRGWWRSLVRTAFGLADGPRLAAVSGDRFEQVFVELYDHFAQGSAWSVFDDVLPALERLKSAGCGLWVLSNFDRRLRRILADHQLAGFFDGMIISSEVGASKPHPLIFEAALREAGAQPAECAHLGDDAVADLRGAELAGLRAFQVHRPDTTLVHLAQALCLE